MSVSSVNNISSIISQIQSNMPQPTAGVSAQAGANPHGLAISSNVAGSSTIFVPVPQSTTGSTNVIA